VPVISRRGILQVEEHERMGTDIRGRPQSQEQYYAAPRTVHGHLSFSGGSAGIRRLKWEGSPHAPAPLRDSGSRKEYHSGGRTVHGRSSSDSAPPVRGP